MKITPINFANLLEPDLISFWETKNDLKDTSVQVNRTHNFKLKQTELTCIALSKTEHTTVFCQIQLVEIPQQEKDASVKCMIHLPEVRSPSQLLMVFKKEEDNAMWVRKIISRIESTLELQDERNRSAKSESENLTEEEDKKIPEEEIEEEGMNPPEDENIDTPEDQDVDTPEDEKDKETPAEPTE